MSFSISPDPLTLVLGLVVQRRHFTKLFRTRRIIRAGGSFIFVRSLLFSFLASFLRNQMTKFGKELSVQLLPLERR